MFTNVGNATCLLFSFYSLPYPSNIWQLLMSHSNMFLSINSIRPVFTFGFINQDFDYNAMSKKVMHGCWISPVSLKELRLTFRANQSPLQKWSDTLLGHIVHSSLSRWEMMVAFLKDCKEGTSRHCGNLKDLKNWPIPTGIVGRAWWQWTAHWNSI